MAQYVDLIQNLADNQSANAVISAYCTAVTNTVVSQSPGNWYKPFMADLGVAQTHASTYLSTIGPDAWSIIPNAIIHYGQTYQTDMGAIQQMVTNVGSGSLTSTQISEIQQVIGALEAQLTTYLGTSTDTNIGPSAPATPSIYGCLNDLNTFDQNITTDNQKLVGGQDGAAQEVGVLKSDEDTMTANIATLNAEITVWNKDIKDLFIGMGVSIAVIFVGIALAPVTFNVITGIGVAGLATTLTEEVIYSDKVKAAQQQIADDTAELANDVVEVLQLQAIISAIGNLSSQNKAAQTALSTTVDAFTTLKTDMNTVLTDLADADSGQVLAFLEGLDIQNAINSWNDLVIVAQGIVSSALAPATSMTAPAPTSSSASKA